MDELPLKPGEIGVVLGSSDPTIICVGDECMVVSGLGRYQAISMKTNKVVYIEGYIIECRPYKLTPTSKTQTTCVINKRDIRRRNDPFEADDVHTADQNTPGKWSDCPFQPQELKSLA